MQALAYDLLYYIYILLFGVYISIRIACGAVSRREWNVFAIISPAMLLAQGICLQLWGENNVWLLYPLIVHLPMWLVNVLALKVKWDRALMSVLISYALCQLPRWVGLVIQAFEPAPLSYVIIHLACSQLILILLDRYCLNSLHEMMGDFKRLLPRMGALPIIYYLYEYFMIYTQRRYSSVQAIVELLPTGLVLFYVLFVIAYRKEMEKLQRVKYQTAALEMKLKQGEQEISTLRAIQDQTAIHRHDLRHHLMMINGLLSSGKLEQAAEYIHDVQSAIDGISAIRHCENETVNLLLCAFERRAGEKNIDLRIKASLPEKLNLPDIELCAMLSNGLENAIHAVSKLPEDALRQIDIFCGVKQNKLLFEIKNPYAGEIIMRDGIPAAANGERRYGCRSIQSIVHHQKGVCVFDATQGVFTLRIAIPMMDV